MRRALETLCITLVITGQITLDLQAGASRSPITVEHESHVRTPAATAEQAASSAEAFLRVALSVADPRLVRYRDRDSLGGPAEGTGWLLKSQIQLRAEGKVEQVLLNVLIDGASGRVVAAYTDANDIWVSPVRPVRESEVEENAELYGWGMRPELPDRMESRVAEVIVEARKWCAFDLGTVGQIVVRPRWQSPRLPAIEVRGQLVPIRKTERVWLVQFCGLKLEEIQLHDRTIYFTGTVLRLVDGTLEYLGGMYFD
jgi:hypothetical protein